MGKDRRSSVLLSTRRDALKQIGVGLGLGVLPACGFPPTLADECVQSPDAWRIPDIATGRDPIAHALLSSVENLVVVMMENRSFDHLLGGLRLDRDYPARDAIDGLRGGESNPDLDGRPILVTPMPGRGDGSINPRHAWKYVRDAWNGGLNDGFIRINAGPRQSEVMSYLRRDQIPFQYAIADNFTVCDRWFSSFMGQTWPNRFYLHATTSGGRRENRPLWSSALPTIWERMAFKCRRIKQYAAGSVLWSTVAFPGKSFSGSTPYHRGSIEDFFRDAQTGNLPEFSVIDPDFQHSDGSPMHDIGVSEAFLSSIYRAMAESSQWSKSMLVVVYDEHGGFFDHVAPPRTVDIRPDFAQLGFRVPAFVVGPMVWKGQVVSTQFEHASVAATLATRFGIDSLGERMDAAKDLATCIDPRVVVPRPAPRLPIVELSARSVAMAPMMTTSQSEIDESVKRGEVPTDLVEARSPEERFRSWLRHAQDLEAVKIVGA
jgi:phospholipase C